MTSTITAAPLIHRLRVVLDRERNALINDTARLLQFRTVSGGTPEQEAEYRREIPACLDWLEAVARRMGFEFRVVHGVVGEIVWHTKARPAGARVPLVAIASHIDVVTPVGEWTHAPFSGEIVDGHVWGRGAQDDKGPLMQSLYALHTVREAGIELPFDVAILVGTMEETGQWEDMKAWCAEGVVPDFAFTPDADFPIINGEKGMVSAIFEATWPDAGIDAETGLEFIRLVGGERENIVPAGAELTLRFPRAARTEVLKELVRTTTSYVVEHPSSNVTMQPDVHHRNVGQRDIDAQRAETTVAFIGKGAHASTPDKGHNALIDALDFIKDVETLPLAVRRFGAFLQIVGGDTTGAALDVALDHHFVGASTACLTLCDLTPIKGGGLVNIRPTMGLSAEETLERCRKVAARFSEAIGTTITVRAKGEIKDPIFVDPTAPRLAPYVAGMRAAFEAVTGRPGDLRAIGGTTYAKALPNCIAFGPVLTPDEPELAHQADERVSLDAIERNTLIYALSLALMGEEINKARHSG